ncbi:MAG: DUF2848 family protein [Mesorhizobium sp.]
MTRLRFATPDGGEIFPAVRQLLLAGYSGRSEIDVDKHLAEMRALGVAVPQKVPVFHPAMTCLLTQGDRVEAIGPDTRPEVEFVLFACEGTDYVTVGNDQFDLATERHYSAQKSKSLCQKVVASTAWALSDVHGHWDQLLLELRSGDRLLQAGTVDSILTPASLVERARRQQAFDRDHGMLFSGTVPMLAPVEPDMLDFSIALRDPVLGRVIGCDFQVVDITCTVI